METTGSLDTFFMVLGVAAIATVVFMVCRCCRIMVCDDEVDVAHEVVADDHIGDGDDDGKTAAKTLQRAVADSALAEFQFSCA